MFKGSKKYLFIFAGLFLAIVLMQYLLPKPVKWTRTYMQKDKIPYGCFAIKNLLQGTFCKNLRDNNQTLYNLKHKLNGNSSVLMIDRESNLNKSDIRSLYEILQQGNNVMIAANNFNGMLADTFHLNTSYTFYDYFSSIDSLIKKPGSSIKLTAGNHKQTYKYSRIAWISYFTNFDSTQFKIKAYTEEKKPCIIETQIGKGRLLLVSAPDIFTNYFIVNHPNRYLPYCILSSLNKDEIIWDEHYKAFNVTNESPLKFIFQNDALYTAYMLMLLSVIFYMIFEGRRRQRPIPLLEPVKNSTLEFVNVITHVYYNSHNHQHIAAERIKYFHEQIRKRFNVNTAAIDEAFIKEISDISGVEFKTVRQLFTYCEKLKSLQQISEQDLIELNRQISNFNKNSLR